MEGDNVVLEVKLLKGMPKSEFKLMDGLNIVFFVKDRKLIVELRNIHPT